MEISKLCKNCLGCNREEDPNFLGVEECENCTLNQAIEEYSEQMKMEGLDDNKNSNVVQKQEK